MTTAVSLIQPLLPPLPAPPLHNRPGCFTVNIGDVLMRWTDGEWLSYRLANLSETASLAESKQSSASPLHC